MPDSSPLSSMFHRRLLLLMGVVAVAMLVLAGQLTRLTVAHGAQLRMEAESKLVNRQWVATTRGRILDRKGRPLAQDRPSFDVAVDFRMISGEWAIKKAGARARKDYGDQWRKLAPEERQPILDTYIAAYQGHLDDMWRLIAQKSGEPEETLWERRKEIVDRVEKMAKSLYASRLATEMKNRLLKGEEISADVELETKKLLTAPIDEQQSPQVILSNVPDEVGFAFMKLTDSKIDLTVPTRTGTALDRVPLLPGLSVVPSGDREYPYEAVSVEVDLSTLPEPVREAGRKTIAVEGVGYHLIGRMKDGAQAEDQDRRAERLNTDPNFNARALVPEGTAGLKRLTDRDRGHYEDDDRCGLAGIEASCEDDLRGLRGLKIEQLETGERSEIAPTPGRDVRLTIDIALQARVQAAMSKDLGLAVAQPWHGAENPTIPAGTPLNGAAVVLEVDSGDILAMVSTPSISRRVLKDQPEAVFEDPVNTQVDVPWIDRAVSRPYPPGSIAKALILNGAVKLGKHSLDGTIECTGFLFPGKPNMFRCWIYKGHNLTHGVLDAEQAMMVSCNIYFFTLGQRLGSRGIVDTYRMFGLGEPLSLGLEPREEFEGFLGYGERDRPSPASTPGQVGIQDAIQMGIGQGPVAWTPLHPADAYCTIARGGVRIKPHLIAGEGSPEPRDLGLDPRTVKTALKGLWNSVNEDQGTGNHLTINERRLKIFNVPGVEVWGKTGTATAPTIFVKPTIKVKDPSDPEHKREIDAANPLWDRGIEAPVIAAAANNPELKFPANTRAIRWGDHSWFVVLVGHESDHRPLYAISVMMEYAGSGGKVSGPIVNQIIHALVAEGYL